MARAKLIAEREAIRRMVDEGKTNREIVIATGRSKAFVQKIASAHKKSKGVPQGRAPVNNGRVSDTTMTKIKESIGENKLPVWRHEEPEEQTGPVGRTMRQSQVIVDAWESSTTEAQEMFLRLMNLERTPAAKEPAPEVIV